MLPRGAYVLTLENGIRFLTDYLLGDKYYSISRPQQNLDRGRTQLALVRAMERRWDELCRIVEEEAQAVRLT